MDELIGTGFVLQDSEPEADDTGMDVDPLKDVFILLKPYFRPGVTEGGAMEVLSTLGVERRSDVECLNENDCKEIIAPVQFRKMMTSLKTGEPVRSRMFDSDKCQDI